MWSEEPFVKTGPIVVTSKFAPGKWEVSEGVRAIDDHFDPALPSKLAQSTNREDLAGQIGDMAELYDTRPRSNCFLESLIEVIE